MNIFLVLCLFFTATLASGGGGGGGWGSHGSIRTPAFVLPIPEIGFTFDKLPLFIPIPKIVLRKKPAVVSKPVFMPIHGFGGFGGHGLSSTIHLGGGGGGGYDGGYEEGY